MEDLTYQDSKSSCGQTAPMTQGLAVMLHAPTPCLKSLAVTNAVHQGLSLNNLGKQGAARQAPLYPWLTEVIAATVHSDQSPSSSHPWSCNGGPPTRAQSAYRRLAESGMTLCIKTASLLVFDCRHAASGVAPGRYAVDARVTRVLEMPAHLTKSQRHTRTHKVLILCIPQLRT
jgi:hypothetical protein